jgi:uncharacterized membrane protein YhfC
MVVKIGTVIAFIISIVLQVGFPLAVSIYYRRRTRAPWQIFLYGGVVYAVFQLFTWLPVSVYLDVAVGEVVQSELGAFVWLLAMALLTSLIEEAGRWWGFRYLFARRNYRLNWRNGVMYGLGHGSVETLLLISGLTFINLLAYIVLSQLDLASITQSLGAEASPALLDALQSIVNTAWWQPPIVAFERMLALAHQVAWSLLVMQSLVSRQKRWFGFAVLYHTSVAVIVPGLVTLGGYAVAEGVNLGFALFSIWLIARLRVASPEG